MECDWLITRGGPKLERARLYDPVAGFRTDPGRSNRAAHMPMSDSDMVMVTIQTRIARAAALPVDGLEALTVLHYTPGQEFRPHFDFQNVDLYSHVVARLGQRVVTFLVYLNDDFDGGETHFPQLDWRFKGGRGDAIFFWNVTPDGRGDVTTQHAGVPPTRGEKWLLSQWIRDRNRPGLNVAW
jgi:prolyl 4-hydroxylase